MPIRPLLLVLVLGLSVLPSTAMAQRSAAASTAAGVGTGGFGGTSGLSGSGSFGGAEGQSLGSGGLDTSAGGSASIDRTFDGTFVGGSDSLDRFVGVEGAGPQQNGGRPNFGALQGAIRTVEPPSPPRSPIRAQLRLGFDPSRVESIGGSVLNGGGGRSSALATPTVPVGISQIDRSLTVRFDGSTARLDGTADTSQKRKLAEAMLRLEPGVRQVENAIQVRGSRTVPSNGTLLPPPFPTGP